MDKKIKKIRAIPVLIAAILIVGSIAYLAYNSGKEKNIKPAGVKDVPVLVPADEVVLRLLVWEGHAPQQYAREFERQVESKYNRKVKVDIKYVVGSDDFYDSVRGKSVDVVMMTHHHYKDERFKYIQNKLLLPLDLKNIPNYEHVLPAIQKAEYLYSEGQVYAVPYSQGNYGLAYNTALLKEEPQSWNVLWDRRFKGKYVIGANEYIYNANITALALGYPRESISSYDALNNKAFKAKLRQLAVNAHSFWVGVDKPDDLSGRSLGTSWGDSMGFLKARGEPWKLAEPAEGMPCWIDNYAITWALADKPFLKKVAEEYINGLLSTAYQVEYVMRQMSLTPIITNIDALLTEEEKERIHIGVPNFFATNRILQYTYTERDRNGLELMWEEATRGIIPERNN